MAGYMREDTPNDKILNLLNKSIENGCTYSNLLLASYCYVNQIYDDETNTKLFDKCIELNIRGAKKMKESAETFRKGPKHFLINCLIESNNHVLFVLESNQNIEEIIAKWVDDLYTGKIAQFEKIIAHCIKNRTYADAFNCYLTVNSCLHKNELISKIDIGEISHYYHFIIDTFYNIFINFDGNNLSKNDIVKIIFDSIDELVTINIEESGNILEKFCDVVLMEERFSDLKEMLKENKWFGENMDTFHNVFRARCIANKKCGSALDFLVSIGTESKYLVSMGTMCFDKGDRENALKYYSKAIELDPINLLAHK